MLMDVNEKLLWEKGMEIVNMGESGHEQVVPISVFVAVLCLCVVIGHLLEENRWVNESLTAILIVIILINLLNYSFFLKFFSYKMKIN